MAAPLSAPQLLALLQWLDVKIVKTTLPWLLLDTLNSAVQVYGRIKLFEFIPSKRPLAMLTNSIMGT